MIELAYIYLIQDGKDHGTDIRKIGLTIQRERDSRIIQRLQSYSQGSTLYYLWNVDPGVVAAIEQKIKEVFCTKYSLARGSEWFHGDTKHMKKDIDAIIDDLDAPASISNRCKFCYAEIHNDIQDSIHQFECTARKIKIDDLKSIVAEQQHNAKSTDPILNVFGQERLDHITKEVIELSILQSDDFIGSMRFLCDFIYFNTFIPENHNVRLDTLTRISIMTYNGSEWLLGNFTLFNTVVDTMTKQTYKFLAGESQVVPAHILKHMRGHIKACLVQRRSTSSDLSQGAI